MSKPVPNIEPNKQQVRYDAWEEIGYHRPLGGDFFNYTVDIVTAIIGILLGPLMIALFEPYPEIKGYNAIAGGLFVLVYQIFDFGTAYGIERYIAENRVKDPEKMLKFAQFYIWYQMMTGLVQVTIISIIVLWILNNTEFAYLALLLLFIAQKQWPGMLGTFKSMLNGLQRYKDSNVLGIIQGEVVQNITKVGFVLLGRWWGQSNPAIGDLMGALIGGAIGVYVDDFFGLVLGIWYIRRVTKPLGFTARDCFRHDFSGPLVKEVLWFGLQMSIVPIINSFTGTLMLLWFIGGIPAYATWIGIKAYASALVGLVNRGVGGQTALIAESYMNGKEKLASFYISTGFRWNGFLRWIFTSGILAFLPVVLYFYAYLPEYENYRLVPLFILPLIITKLSDPFIGWPDGVMVGTNRIAPYTAIRLLEEGMQVANVWIWVFVIQAQNWGPLGIVLMLSFDTYGAKFIKMVIIWVYMKRHMFPVKIYWWQSVFGPMFSCLPLIPFGLALYWGVFLPLTSVIGMIPAAVVLILIGILVGIPFIYCPMTGLLGCWDDFALKTMEKAVSLSGPSKWLVKVVNKTCLWGCRHSRLHNRFRIPWEEATKEMAELQDLKRRADAKVIDKRVKNAPWLKHG